MYTYTSINEPEEGLAKYGLRAIFTHRFLHVIYRPGASETTKSEGTLPETAVPLTPQASGGVTKTTLRFSNSLEGFIELDERYRTYSYDLLQGNDTH